jgi:hypothetical protein
LVLKKPEPKFITVPSVRLVRFRFSVISVRFLGSGSFCPGLSPAAATSSSFELFYDDGAGSSLRPLPESMSDFLMGFGFERLLEQLA